MLSVEISLQKLSFIGFIVEGYNLGTLSVIRVSLFAFWFRALRSNDKLGFNIQTFGLIAHMMPHCH